MLDGWYHYIGTCQYEIYAMACLINSKTKLIKAANEDCRLQNSPKLSRSHYINWRPETVIKRKGNFDTLTKSSPCLFLWINLLTLASVCWVIPLGKENKQGVKLYKQQLLGNVWGDSHLAVNQW